MPVTIVMNGASAGRGLGISGTFTASPPLCPSGRFEDGTGTPVGALIRVTRYATCDNGAGEVESQYFGTRENMDGPGSWKVLTATGELKDFRGLGSTSNHSIEHDPETGTRRFVNTWTGRADLDSTPPSARLNEATARVVGHRLVVRGAFSAADNDRANAVGFRATLWVRESRVARQAGEARDGLGAVAFSVKRRRELKTVRLELVLSDPLLNERTVNRIIPVRR